MDNRFYREPEPIGVGSIVVRFAKDGTLTVGQIVKPDDSLKPGKRWYVFGADGLTRWHASTILRRLDSWEEAHFVKGADAAINALYDQMPEAAQMDAMLAVSRVRVAVAKGVIRP